MIIFWASNKKVYIYMGMSFYQVSWINSRNNSKAMAPIEVHIGYSMFSLGITSITKIYLFTYASNCKQ